LPVDVDGSAEEVTPFIPAHGMRQISFLPGPSGFRFYHTHLTPGADLTGGQYSGLVGPVYIEPKHEPGAYDREVFLTLKEFQPTLNQSEEMSSDFLAGEPVVELKDNGEQAMAASVASGMPRGYEIGHGTFTINGRTLGHGDPIQVKTGAGYCSMSSTAVRRKTAASPCPATPSPSWPSTAIQCRNRSRCLCCGWAPPNASRRSWK
jgi:hypothetical protein